MEGSNEMEKLKTLWEKIPDTMRVPLVCVLVGLLVGAGGVGFAIYESARFRDATREQERLRDLNTKLLANNDAIIAKVGDLQQQLKQFTVLYAGLGGKLDESIGYSKQSIQAIGEFRQFGDKLDSVAQSITDKYGTVDAAIGGLQGDTASIAGAVGSVLSELDKFSGSYGQLADLLSGYAGIVSDYTKLVESVSGRFDSVDAAIGGLQSSASAINGSVQSIQANLSGALSANNELRQLVAGSLDSLQTSLATATQNGQLSSSSVADVKRLQDVIAGFADKYKLDLKEQK